ncbi:MAG: thiolase domain-containing protein [Anaerolineales bacterium]|nr:thiolase domain-containing protein [Anaerolineales bacterium]
MRQIAIIGIGQTPVSENWDQSLREIAGEAVLSALVDAGLTSVDGLFIGNMLSGQLSKQENLGALISDWTGLRGRDAVKVEAACGSGAAALRLGIMAVGSGELDSAIVAGVEKMTETKGPDTTAALATAADADYEVIQGVTFVGLNALVMQRYLHEYGWRHTDFASFSINAHANAIHNPYARLREEITEKDYQRARMIADPINLLDASPIGDGAAAVVIVAVDDLGGKFPAQNTIKRPTIRISGSASATDYLAVHSRKDPLWLSAAALSARQAYGQAGITPKDVDFFELHDAFSIMSALSLEACGFVERGQAPRLGLDREIGIHGRIPISTRGGLKARGHPVGATGVYQIVEAVQQLRCEAGATQVEGARIGMTQNIGGSGATIITHILESDGMKL